MAEERESGRSARLLEIVGEALDRAPADRSAFLDEACGNDDPLRAEAESLVRLDEPARDFIARSALAAHAASLLEMDSAAPPATTLKPGQVLGDFRIDSLLGEGGMGEVYLAEDMGLGRRVAIKLVKAGMTSREMLHRFGEEKRILAGLNDPHIARLYGGAVNPGGLPYLVMEYVEGERLDEYCDKRLLPIEERLALFRKVCVAVAYAHQNLVVHRDLKPANIRVTAGGEPKLLDFGIAKLLDPDSTRGAEQTVTMYAALTPEYASPEQLRGEAITTASDVYSLGVVLYELLTGQRPYDLTGRRSGELAQAICEREPTRPSVAVHRATTRATVTPIGGEPAERLRRRLQGDLDNIVAMAMRKDPARRYASVAQFSEDLRRHEEGLPVLARNDTLGYRTGKFVRRNRLAVAAGILLLLALLGGLAATAWQAHAARLAQTRAELAQSRAEHSQVQTERLNGFLQTLLGSANPENGPGRDLKVIQVLDQASEHLDAELAGEPALLAQAHLTMGEAYTGLQAAEPAVRHLRAAVELGRKAYGDDDINTAHAEAALGVALYLLERRYAEAEQLLSKALAVERRQPAGRQRELATILNFEARSLAALGRYAEAKPLAAESFALTLKDAGEQSPQSAKGLVLLATLDTAMGNYGGAEASLRRAIAIFRQLGASTPSVATTLTSLAYILILQGKLDEPEALLLEAQERYRATVGEKSIEFCMNLGTLGWLHFLRGDYPAAERELRQSQVYARPLVPKGEQDLVGGAVTLARAMIRQGKFTEAEPYLRESLEQAKANHLIGMAAPSLIETELGDCLQAQGRLAEAEEFLLAAYNELKASRGKHARETLDAGRRLHDFYVSWNKPAEADRFQ